MSLADDTSYVGTKLPFDDFEFVAELETIEFKALKKRFVCDITEYSCTVGDTRPSDVPYVESPDERWEAFVVEQDLQGRTVHTSDADEEYARSVAAPIREAQALVAGAFWQVGGPGPGRAWR